MAKRKLAMIATVFCICFCLMSGTAHAISTADATEPIAVDADCLLTLNYAYDGKAFEALDVRLYKIATVSADFQYSLCADFESSGLILNGVQTSGEWDAIRTTLEAQIIANGIQPLLSTKTSAAGQAAFSGLKPGLYLAMTDDVAKDDYTYSFDSALIALPGLSQEGTWQYQLSVTSKAQALPPAGGDETIEYRVLKLWKGDTYFTRPKSIMIEIFRDGKSVESLELTSENNWSYSWSAKDDGAKWIVVERNVPNGYTVMADVRDTTFIISNTKTPDPYTPPGTPPKTGDSSNMMLYLALMYCSGMGLVLLSLLAKKKRV